MKNNSPAQRALAFVLSLAAFIVLCQYLCLGQNVSPQNLGFGNVAVNVRAAKTLTITDDSQRDLVVESVTVRGTAFAISTPAMPMTLTPGGSTGFVVTFTPPTSGTFDGNILMTLARHDGGTDRSRSLWVSLSGTGAGSGTGSPVLQSITVSPTSASISVGATQQFTATGHYSNGSTQTLTSGTTWSSSSTTYATIGATGLATGVAAGSTNITASSGGVVSTPAAALAVTASTPVLQSITISPTSASIAVGATQQFTATGHYSNGSTQTLASGMTWSSSATTYATIGATGLATGVAAGSTSIAASSSGVVSAPAAALAVTAAVTTGSGKSFYVAPTGSDSNPGTSASPWLTIQHAASTVPAGSTVYVAAGTYNESINVTVSGTSSAPITFTGESGAIVSGTGLTPSTSQTQGLWNIGSATPAGVDVSYITIQGFTIENYTTSNANACPAGIWISGASNGIQILNNTITNITTTSEKEGNAFGISAYGTETTAINGLVISGNTVYGLKTGNSETVNVDGNVTNFTITNNTIHDNDNIGIDAIGGEGVGPSGYDYARYGEISGNTVYNISAIDNAGEGDQYDADGIYCDTCAYVVIERNLVHNCDLNIEVASEHSGKYSQYVTVRNNVVYNANSVGISIGGYASNVGGSQYVTIANNTLFEDDTQNTGSGELQVQYYATNNVFENNLVYATSQGLFINNYTNSEANPVTADYNLYYSSVSSSSAQFIWDGASENGFSSYQSTTGQESHSQYANPLFLSSTTLNLQVQASSPAINAGSTLSSLICSNTTGETGDYWGCPLVGTLDFLGNPREPGSNIDIGAYEQ
ncbi:MAG: Ig-like domain-containing protein [Candidatus Sulfotelmatobacter sp.]